MNKKNKLTLEDRAILRDILNVILEDDDLRTGFRGACCLTTGEMRRLHRKLDQGIDEEIGADDSFKVRTS